MRSPTDMQLDFDSAALGCRVEPPERIANPDVVGMIAGQSIKFFTQRIIALDSDDDRGHFIDVRHQSLGIDQDYSILQAFNDRFGLALFKDQALDVHLIVVLETLRHLVELACDRIQLIQLLWTQPQLGSTLAYSAQAFSQLT